MSYTLDIENLKRAHNDGILGRGEWGDGVEMVCVMSALIPGATSIQHCITEGWTEWLVRLVIELNDKCPNDETQWEFAQGLVLALQDRPVITEAMAREHARRCLIRCLDYVGEGSEGWRVECRTVVSEAAETLHTRWLNSHEAARAASAANAEARAAWAAWAVESAEDAWPTWAMRATRSAGSTGVYSESAESAERAHQRNDLVEILAGAAA